MDVRAGSQLESDAGSTVGAVGDERLAPDPDEINLTHRPRRHDDDDEGSDVGDDDAESTASAQAAKNLKGLGNVEEEKELPLHACA